MFTHLAGVPGGPGSTDEQGSGARFTYPRGVATDGMGNVYVADTGNHTVRKITPDGTVTTLAGTAGVAGYANGVGSAALFDTPSSLAADSAGNIYVADSANSVIRKITPEKVVTTLAGSPNAFGRVDGIGSSAQFGFVTAIAIDRAGNLYATDLYCIRKITPSGSVTTLAGVADEVGHGDGMGTAARFGRLTGITVDDAGNVYVGEEVYTLGAVTASGIRKITPDGTVTTIKYQPEVIIGLNSEAGVYPDQRVWGPIGVAIDHQGNLYVADQGYSIIRKVTPSGDISTFAGRTITYDDNTPSPDTSRGSFTGQELLTDLNKTDGVGREARFHQPLGIAVDGSGNVFVADTRAHTIRKITPAAVVTTLAGMARGIAGSADGVGASAQFYYPNGVTVDGNGSVFIADTNNNTIRKITPNGTVTTLAGNNTQSGSGDGTGESARFYGPMGLTVDSSGNVYVCDEGNATIRRVSPAGVVTTLAGSPGYYGNAGHADGIGVLAQFDLPQGVAVDKSGHLYVADYGNCKIRKITPDGTVTSLAGSLTGDFGLRDGTGSEALFRHPSGPSLDAAGNIYVADQGNSAIRKITPAGVVTTVAGGQTGYADGIGSSAKFNQPTGVAVDINTGFVYVADTGNNLIRRVSPAGDVTTVGGTTGIRGSADGLGINAQFNAPMNVAVDPAGNLYVSDSGNNAIRKGMPAGLPVITNQPASQILETGKNVSLSVAAGSAIPLTYQWYFNQTIFKGATESTLSLANAQASDDGDYTVVVTNALGSITSSKATLTVASAPASAPPTPSSSSGGGGATEPWLALVFLALTIASAGQRTNPPDERHFSSKK